MPSFVNGDKIQVYIVDDQELIRRGVTSIVNAEPDMIMCGQTASADIAFQEITVLAPHIVIVDPLERDNGMHWIAALRRQLPLAGVIALSAHDERTHAREALEAGAHGYVMKSDSFDRIVSAIRSVAAGRIVVSTSVADSIVGSHAQRHRKQGLTPREREIVELIGKGECPRSICCQLRVSRKTIASHVAHIKQALQLANSVELVSYCVRWVKANDHNVRNSRLQAV